MYEYSHGGNAAFEYGRENIIDLSANINPLGMPENVKEAIIRGIQNCDRYPDSSSKELREKISKFENIKPENIFCGNGTSDIIFRIPKALGAKKIMIMAPAFHDYERSAKSFGSTIIRYSLFHETGFDPDSGIVKKVQCEKPDLVFFCNPNNPTGRLAKAELIEELLDCCQRMGSYVVVDECFMDFAEQAEKYTSKVFCKKYSNLIILKAFTKLFALPGIRLGYVVCTDNTFMDNLYFHGPDWPVSNLAQAAGIAALENASPYIKKTVEYVSAERIIMEKELSWLGYTVFESSANFVLIKNPYSFDLGNQLDKKEIRIRSCKNFHGLDNTYYRIAVSTKENNTKFLNTVTRLTKPYYQRDMMK